MSRNYSSISEEKTLAANVTEASTTLTVNESTTGLPTVPFVFVINPDTALEEAVLATVKSGSTYTITRNIEGGGVKSHTIGQSVRHMIVGSDLQLVHSHLDNTTTAHGIDTKAPLASPTFTGTVVLPSATSIGNVTSAELGYVDGVTSAIQTQLNALTSSIASIVTVPTGVISQFAGPITSPPAPPTGWLLCDGTAVSRSTYATLFGIVSTTYGIGDNSTTFNLPNLKGKVPVGLDASQTEFNLLGETGGVKTVILDITQIPAHTHAGQIVFDSGNDAGTGSTGVTANGVGDSQPAVGTTGGGLSHDNLQPYIVVNYIIKI